MARAQCCSLASPQQPSWQLELGRPHAGGGLLLLLFLLGLASWLESLGAELDATADASDSWEGVGSFSPGADVLHGLSESSVKSGLEGGSESLGDDDVSNGS